MPSKTIASQRIRVLVKSLMRLCAAVALLGVACSAASAQTTEAPIRKAGLWDFTVKKMGGALPAQVIKQLCTDETTPFMFKGGKECTPHTTRKTATGYTISSTCTINGARVSTKTMLTGDFSATYTAETQIEFNVPGSVQTVSFGTLEGKWIGPCAAGQKPGDLTFQDGNKGNINEPGQSGATKAK